MPFTLLNGLPAVRKRIQRKDCTSRDSVIHLGPSATLDSTPSAIAQETARRRYRRRKHTGVKGGGDDDGVGGGEQGSEKKRSRTSRRSNNESNSSSNNERKKKRRVVRAAAAAPRRLVKPHQKRAKKLVTGGGETEESPIRLLEDTSSSSSDGGADAGGVGSPGVGKGNNKRMAEKSHAKKAKVGSGKQKKDGGSGSGQSVDLLDSLIGNTASSRKSTPLSGCVTPSRTKMTSSNTQSVFSRQSEESQPSLSRHRSADAYERRDGGGAAPATAVTSSDERVCPQLVRGGSLDSSSLSLAQYKTGAVRRTEAQPPRAMSSSSSTRIPVAPPAEYKIPKVTPNGVLRKKGGALGDRQGLHTPAYKGNISTAQDAPAPLQATSNRIKVQYEKVPHYVGVRRKKSNGKYFVWVGDQPLDGTEYER